VPVGPQPAGERLGPPPVQVPHFQLAIKALDEGNLSMANEHMVGGPTENQLGGFVAQINAIDGKAAIWFSGWWASRMEKVASRADAIPGGRRHDGD
jgi:hypothetical protein